MSTAVELEIDRQVARVTFRGPKGIQLFGAQARADLRDVLDRLESEEDCRVAVFQAEGRTFIAGADIKELSQLDAKSATAVARDGQALMNRVAKLKAVTLAAIHGPCAGGGCELALACDLRVGAASMKLGLPEVTLGIIPGWGGTVRATKLFGGAIARRMILTGELFPAEAALAMGLVDSVYPDDEFRSQVDARIDLLLSRGPVALRVANHLIGDFEGDLSGQLEAEAYGFGECFASGEGKVGTAAFVAKEAPLWANAEPEEPEASGESGSDENVTAAVACSGDSEDEVGLDEEE